MSKKMTFDQFIKSNTGIVQSSNLKYPEMISSGIFKLDKIINVDKSKYKDNKQRMGIPLRQFTQITGEQSTGKSLLCLQICREFLSKKKSVIYLDLEDTVEKILLDNMGFYEDNLDEKFYLIKPKGKDGLDIEHMYDTIFNSTEHFDLIVIDSLPMMMKKDAEKDSVGKAIVGGTAKEHTSGFLRIKQIMSTNTRDTTVVFTNQIRANITTNQYSAQAKREFHLPGGHAVQHGVNLWIHLTKSTQIKMKDNVIGYNIRYRIGKNKVGAMGQKFIVTNYTGYENKGRGYDQNIQILDLGKELGLIKSSGNSWILSKELTGSEEVKLKTKDALFNYFLNEDDNPKIKKILNHIKKVVLEKFYSDEDVSKFLTDEVHDDDALIEKSNETDNFSNLPKPNQVFVENK